MTTINWDLILRIRVKEHLYTEFKQAVRNFKTNKKNYVGKYVPKVWDTIQTLNNNQYLTLKGLPGAYKVSLFHPMSVKVESNILKRIPQLFASTNIEYSCDTHDQSVNYVFHKSQNGIDIDPISVVKRGENDENNEYRVNIDAACFSDMSEKFDNMVDKGYDVITGYFYINPNISTIRVEKFLALCRKHNLLSPEITTDLSIDNGNPYVRYQLVFHKDKVISYDKLYFGFSLIRFVLEYHGTLNIMFDLMKEAKLNMVLAMILSMMYQLNKRWLHVPWETKDEYGMDSACRWAKAIINWKPGCNLFEKRNTIFRCSPAVRKKAEVYREQMSRTKDKQDVRDIKFLNNIVEGK